MGKTQSYIEVESTVGLVSPFKVFDDISSIYFPNLRVILFKRYGTGFKPCANFRGNDCGDWWSDVIKCLSSGMGVR